MIFLRQKSFNPIHKYGEEMQGDTTYMLVILLYLSDVGSLPHAYPYIFVGTHMHVIFWVKKIYKIKTIKPKM